MPTFRALPLVLLLLALPLAAQTPPRLTASRELLFDADQADLGESGRILLHGATLVATQPKAALVRLLETGRVASLGRRGEGPGEFRAPTVAGIVADTLWIGDVALRRTLFYRPDRTLLRTVPWPAADRASPAGARWLALLPLAYRRDGTMLVEEVHDAGAPRPQWATPVQWTGSAILLLQRDGTMQRIVGWLPDSRCSEDVPVSRGNVIVTIPFCHAVVRDVAPDGERLAFALPGAKPGTARIVVLGATGDTIFTREIARPAVPIPAALRDSVRASAMTIPGGPPLEKALSRIPTSYAAVPRILVGRDRSVWIEVATAGGPREWWGYDPAGAPLGSVQLGRAVRPVAAERGTLWATETDEDGLQQVVRFRLTPAR